ncbi:MAG: terpene cyclase/mutase family protein [Phycisphaerae bacterium]|nr:terpene cyclase/mutase family protein [Phycisphaerae bacterium]
MVNRMRVVLILFLMLGSVPAGCKKPARTQPAASAAVKELSLPPAATDAIDAEHLKKAQKLINGGIAFLLAGRDADGGWSFAPGNVQKPAATALALKVIVQHPDFDSKSPVIDKGFKVLLGYRQNNGGVYDPKQGYRTYTTCTAVMALAVAKDPRFNSAIRTAEKYLRGVQIKPGDESPDGRKIKPGDPEVGGVGYGKSGVPNLSVLSFWTDAMHDAGVAADDPAMKSALEFLRMLQNDSEENPRHIEGPDDGGFRYDLKTSKAGPGPGGKGLRSYGSMTYAAFKSLLYAGVGKDDSRVKSAFGWIRKHWRLDSNPNMPLKQSQEGLYYYYHVFAKALRAYGEPEITDTKGKKHNWRHELIDALGERVAPDGSWVNQADRWQEGSKVLVTCYATLALQESLQK